MFYLRSFGHCINPSEDEIDNHFTVWYVCIVVCLLSFSLSRVHFMQAYIIPIRILCILYRQKSEVTPIHILPIISLTDRPRWGDAGQLFYFISVGSGVYHFKFESLAFLQTWNSKYFYNDFAPFFDHTYHCAPSKHVVPQKAVLCHTPTRVKIYDLMQSTPGISTQYPGWSGSY